MAAMMIEDGPSKKSDGPSEKSVPNSIAQHDTAIFASETNKRDKIVR